MYATWGTWILALIAIQRWGLGASVIPLVTNVGQSFWARAGREALRSLLTPNVLLLLSGAAAVCQSTILRSYDLCPPLLIPLLLPLGISAMFTAVTPVSFLVLGPSDYKTARLCNRLRKRFFWFRTASALDPVQLGAVVEGTLGPDIIRMFGARPWLEQLKPRLEDAAFVIVSGHKLTGCTRQEIDLLMSSPLHAKTIVVEPLCGDFARVLLGQPLLQTLPYPVLEQLIKTTTAPRLNPSTTQQPEPNEPDGTLNIPQPVVSEVEER